MKSLLVWHTFLALIFLVCPKAAVAQMVLVDGGVLKRWFNWSDQELRINPFQISKLEVTWAEWQNVSSAARSLGYDVSTVGTGLGPNHPVQSISWYDALKWCNARSELEGLQPVYWVGASPYRSGETIPSIKASANGYRLPAEAEWDWAARGGKLSRGFEFSGSNNADDVSWFWHNAEGIPRAVGTKLPNELGLHDMSGNVNEWCWDEHVSNPNYRFIRGGSADGLPGYGSISYFGLSQAPDSRWEQTGFRPARTASAPPKPAPKPKPVRDRTRPTFKITAPQAASVTIAKSRVTLRGVAKDNVSPTRIQFKVKSPKGSYPKNWINVSLPKGDEKTKGWSRSIAVNRKGEWAVRIRVLDAQSNASAVRTVTIRRK